MKNSILPTLLLFALLLFSSNSLLATNPISQEVAFNTDTDIVLVSKTAKKSKIRAFFKKLKKGANQLKSKIVAKYYQIAGIFNDPVKKWLWFWLIFGLLSVILIALAVASAFGSAGGLARALYYLGVASGVFSSVSFVIWIIKLIQQ